MPAIRIQCHNASAFDLGALNKIMTVAGVLPSEYEITSFKKKDKLDLDHSINVVCSDFSPNVEEESGTCYFWSTPRVFMQQEAQKREVWNEVKDSLVPILRTMVPDVELSPASIFGQVLDKNALARATKEWQDRNQKLVVTTVDGQEVHVFPGELPGENERELTIEQLTLLAFSMLALGGDLVRVTRSVEGGDA